MKKLFIGAAALGIILAGCDAPTGATGGGSGKTVTQLMDAEFNRQKWTGWKDTNQARHKCPEKLWFYTGIGGQTTVEGLNAFWDGANPEGLDMNQSGCRSFKVAQLVLTGQPITED